MPVTLPMMPRIRLATSMPAFCRMRIGRRAHTSRKTDTDRRTRNLINQLRALHPGATITIDQPAA